MLLVERSGLGDCFVCVDQIGNFQDILNGYQIKIISKQHGDALVYAGPKCEDKIYLYLHDNNYTVIKSMASFHFRSFYCHECDTPYTNKRGHRCVGICNRCNSDQCQGRDEVVCRGCNIGYFSEDCFRRHKENLSYCKGKSKCDVVKVCGDCGK